MACPLTTSPSKPRSKRAKVSGDKEEGTSIRARVDADRYNTLSEFLSDIERASAAVIERSKSRVSENDSTALTETVNRIAAFKKTLNSLVRQAQTSPASIKAEPSAEEAEAEVPAQPAPSDVEVRNDGVALTLFGNPANPKQLYSSLQKSVKVPLPSDDPKSQKYVEVQTPLPEVGLPNGITTAKIAPHKLDATAKEHKRTFGEVFAPRSALPQLELPRRTRSSFRSVGGWIDPFEAITNFNSFLGDRNNYCLAPLPSGDWLQYGSAASRRQKHQASQPQSDEGIRDDPALWVDEDASAIQKVYSSFAPSFDSSGAVLQADAKNLVWWSKRGARRLQTLLSVPYEEKRQETVTAQPGNIGELDESTLEEMVKSFNPEDFTDGVTGADSHKLKDEEAQDMATLLHDVSDLLETLSSYQKIRSLQFSPPGGQDPEALKGIVPDQGTWEAPTEAERVTYEALRSGLATLVSTLPPYAVAKLDGDQLADLNISQKVVVENPDYNGTMEKDDFTIQQERAAAMTSMGGGGGRNATPSRHGSFQAGYNQRAYSANTRVPPGSGAFQPPQPYYSGRHSSTPGPFTPGQPQSFAGGRPPSTPSQRPGYPPGYSQQASQFAPIQRAGQNTPIYPGQQGPPQPSPQPFTPRPGQPGQYNTQFVPGRGSGSPQKQPSFAAPRTPYMTPGPGAQQRYPQPQPQPPPQQKQPPPPQHQPQPQPQPQPSQPQPQPQQGQQQRQQQPPQPGNPPSNPTATPSANYANSAAAMTYARSAAEQAVLMDRNRAQLAAHQSRQSPSSPQPPPEQGTSQEPGGGTPQSKKSTSVVS